MFQKEKHTKPLTYLAREKTTYARISLPHTHKHARREGDDTERERERDP